MHLPSPKKLKEDLPLTAAQFHFIETARLQAKQIVEGTSCKLAIIAGPCSIHHHASALEYASRMKALSEKVNDGCFLVMRAYAEKPRTALGWKGHLYDPHLDGSHDIRAGLYSTRKLLLELANLEVPVATEFVDPLTAAYFSDLITWGFIGARTSESQPHRQLASSLPFPVGLKNATDGHLDGAINGVLSAQHPHRFLSINQEGCISSQQSDGNPHAHIVLRGSCQTPNYDDFSVQSAVDKLLKTDLPPRLMIDCGHGNCQKQYQKQKEVFLEIIERISQGNSSIFGLMLESHLEAGNQTLPFKSSVSITDPCLDWESTEELIIQAAVPLQV